MLKSNFKTISLNIIYIFVIVLAIILTPTIIDILLNIGRFIGTIAREVSICYI